MGSIKLASSVVDRAALRNNGKDWLCWNQDNVSINKIFPLSVYAGLIKQTHVLILKLILILHLKICIKGEQSIQVKQILQIKSILIILKLFFKLHNNNNNNKTK